PHHPRTGRGHTTRTTVRRPRAEPDVLRTRCRRTKHQRGESSMIPNARLQPFVRRGRRVLCSALLAGLALAPGLAPAVAMAAPRDPISAVTLGTPARNIDDVVRRFEPHGGVGSGVATFNVTLSALPAAGPVSVHFATAPVASSETNGEPATPGSDFVSTSGDLDFRCGEPLTKQIHVTIVDDGLDGDSTHLY